MTAPFTFLTAHDHTGGLRAAAVAAGGRAAGDSEDPRPVDVLLVGLPGSDELDRRTRIFEAVSSLVADLRPLFVVWENVRGLNGIRQEAVLQAHLDALRANDYLTRYTVIDPRRYVGAGTAKRLWIIGSEARRDLPEQPRWPKRTSSPLVPSPCDPVAYAILDANGF